MASQPVSSTTICNYNFDSYIRGYHAYKDRWNQPWIGEVLPLESDPTNPHDKFAVAVKKCGETVGHLPFNVAPVVSEDLDEEERQFDLEPPPPKITRYQDAIASLEAVQTFLDSKGHSEEATRVASTMDRVAYFHISTLNFARRSTLEEFFPPV